MHRLTFLVGGCAASGAATFFSLKPVFAASDSEIKNTIKLSEVILIELFANSLYVYIYILLYIF